MQNEFEFNNEDKGNRFTSNPRVFTGLGLLLVVSLLFLNKTSAFILLILIALNCEYNKYQIRPKNINLELIQDR